MNKDDLDSLVYGFQMLNRITPLHDSPHAFNGRIWVLTSRVNFSAAEVFARVSKLAGFTLVGETTGGAIGWAGLVYFRLPNTGKIVGFDTVYVTDCQGRAKEEFPTQPHYFTRAGMCALQTTLALIVEGFP